MPQTNEEIMAAFDEKFSDSQTMSLERQLGSIKSFLLTSLTNARKEAKSEERARILEVIEKMSERHKVQACDIANMNEFDPTNMLRYMENPLIQALVIQHIDVVRELADILNLINKV